MEQLRQLYLIGGYLPVWVYLGKLLLPAALVLAVVSLVRGRLPILAWLLPPLIVMIHGSVGSASLAVRQLSYVQATGGYAVDPSYLQFDQVALLHTSLLLVLAAHATFLAVLVLVGRHHRTWTPRPAKITALTVSIGSVAVFAAIKLAGGALPLLLIPYTLLAAGSALALVSLFEGTSEDTAWVSAAGRVLVSIYAIGAVVTSAAGIYRYGQVWPFLASRLESIGSYADHLAIAEAAKRLAVLHGVLCASILVVSAAVVVGPRISLLVRKRGRWLWLALGVPLTLLAFVRFIHGGVFTELEVRQATWDVPLSQCVGGPLPAPVVPGATGDLHVATGNDLPLFAGHGGDLVHFAECGFDRQSTLGFTLFDLLTRRAYSRGWPPAASMAHAVFPDFAQRGTVAVPGADPARSLLPHLRGWGARLTLPLDFMLLLDGCAGIRSSQRTGPSHFPICKVAFRWVPADGELPVKLGGNRRARVAAETDVGEFWASLVYRNHPALTLVDTELGTVLWVPGENPALIGLGSDAHRAVAEHVHARTPSMVVLVPAASWTVQDLVSFCLASRSTTETSLHPFRGEFACYVTDTPPLFPAEFDQELALPTVGDPVRTWEPDRFVQDEWFLFGRRVKRDQQCHRKALVMDPREAGSLAVTLDFSPDDGALFPSLDASTFDDRELEACILEWLASRRLRPQDTYLGPVALTMRFPPPEEPIYSMKDRWEIMGVTVERASFQTCYEEARQRRPDLRGGIELRIRVDAEGIPHDTEVLLSSLDDPVMERCVIQRLERYRFGKRPSGGTGGVVMPISFDR